MAGNVKEWCWNEGGQGKRFIMGGGFGEPAYMFNSPDAQLPWGRRPYYGFRCAKLDAPANPAATATIEPSFRDLWKEMPVSEEVFEVYRGLFAYDEAELNARVEETETTENWVWEKVSFDAAYGRERVTAHVYLPKNASPPFQTVVYFPGIWALFEEEFVAAGVEDNLDFLLRSGRALIHPIYVGTYERRDGLPPDGKPLGVWRDHVILWSKDVGRTLDYLETRNDIDSAKLAYVGFSMGGALAPALLAIETRFETAILYSAGFWLRDELPEAHQLNFAPRVRVPVLMLNGRYDDRFPLEFSQLPLFHLLGTPDENKKHVLFEKGHAYFRPNEEIRDTLDWLDKYLGPVER
jgi:dienelactone hydrolase